MPIRRPGARLDAAARGRRRAAAFTWARRAELTADASRRAAATA